MTSQIRQLRHRYLNDVTHIFNDVTHILMMSHRFLSLISTRLCYHKIIKPLGPPVICEWSIRGCHK